MKKIKQLVEKLDVLIIDDSSPDGTADIVRELGGKYEKNYGYSESKKDGIGCSIPKKDSNMFWKNLIQN